MTSVLLFPIVPAEAVTPVMTQGAVFLLTVILVELLTGVAMGLVGQLVFAVLNGWSAHRRTAALSFANIVDSTSEIQNTVVSNFYTTLAIIVFLTIGGDHLYLEALVYSFQIIPISGAALDLTTPHFIDLATYLFIAGVQLSAPFLIVLFMLNLSFAILPVSCPRPISFLLRCRSKWVLPSSCCTWLCRTCRLLSMDVHPAVRVPRPGDRSDGGVTACVRPVTIKSGCNAGALLRTLMVRASAGDKSCCKRAPHGQGTRRCVNPVENGHLMGRASRRCAGGTLPEKRSVFFHSMTHLHDKLAHNL